MKFFTLSFNANQNRSPIYLLHQHVCNQMADTLCGNSVYIWISGVFICIYGVYICISGPESVVCICIYSVYICISGPDSGVSVYLVWVYGAPPCV